MSLEKIFIVCKQAEYDSMVSEDVITDPITSECDNMDDNDIVDSESVIITKI